MTPASSQQIQSPVIPSSPHTNSSSNVPPSHMQDSSLITSPTIQQQQQQMLHQQTIQLQHHPQSPSSQHAPRSPLSHQIQPLPPSSPRSQQPLQPPQTQTSRLVPQKQLHPHTMNPSLMDIDVSAITPKLTSDGITTTTVTAGTSNITARQIAPIAPASSGGLPSLMNMNKTPGVRTTLMPHLVQNMNTSLPETPASLSMPEPDDGDKQLLSKRKIQQLVDQIDPKERLEPEVEEVSYSRVRVQIITCLFFPFSHLPQIRFLFSFHCGK